MARSTSTGLYTRIDNSFSNPVIGTTISPTDADTYFDDIDSAMNAFIGTSTTSLAIALGSKSFTTQASKTFLVGSFVQAMSQADRSNYMYGSVTSYNDSTGALVLNVVQIGGSGTLNDWLLITAGARGGAGPVSGFRQLYSSTTTDADPGAGTFRLNHATPGSATAGYFDNVDTAGGTVSSIIDKWDDSTTTTKGFLRIEKEGDTAVWTEFTVTGSVVDGTGYRKVTLSAGSSNGTFTTGDAFRISFNRSGDKGADGSGTFPGSATDNAVVRFDGTGGATVQNSGVTIDDSNNVSGVAKLTTTGDIELGNASDTTVSRAAAGTIAVEGVNVLTTATGAAQGKQTIGVASGGIFPATTNGCAALAQAETTTNKINYKYLAFDAAAVEYAWVWFPTPKSYNASTFTMRFVWTHPSTATNFDVVWQVEMLSVADDDALDTAVGTAVTVTDTGGTTQDFYTSAETGAITPSNTASKQDWIACRVSRLATNGSDTMTVDAHLIGVEIYYSTNSSTDA